MGDYCETISDGEATAEEAPALAQRVVDWLVQGEIVDGQPRRWVFGDTGYLPGRGYHKATTHPESIWFHYDSGREVRHPPAWFEQRPAPDLSHLTREQREDISLSNVALRLKVGREVHYAIGSDVWCPKCGAPFSWFEHERGPGSEETHDAWLSAVTNWYEGGEGVLICPGCSRRMTVKDLAYDPPWGFGYLAFEFWNWGGLRLDFIRQIARLLGHAISVPYYKL